MLAETLSCEPSAMVSFVTSPPAIPSALGLASSAPTRHTAMRGMIAPLLAAAMAALTASVMPSCVRPMALPSTRSRDPPVMATSN